MYEELTIIVPIYNEEDGIEKTIKEIRRFLPKNWIIAVNDCSKDDTLKILKKLASKDRKIKIISHEKNKGHGGALKTGFKQVKTKYIGILDADLSYNPKYLPPMLHKIEKDGLDIIWGNRFGGNINKMAFVRRLGNNMLSLLFLLVTGRYIPDCSSGERIFKTDSLRKLGVESSPDGLDFVCAISKRTITRNLKYKIVPINYFSRSGISKLNVIKDFIRMVKTIIVEK
ncbi:hypothetical protein CMO94_01675 [Candidatus Woesearchaeota archaeon]|jgi:glycosyltransferase involved in cell wall biosynthesis|nr:hypothetical protein [Candidatus Woesearchaeota archaeon]|tara:strand:- start:4209 stop:4892 length:684 start_codon:yes stop_codon:yes gene_type:complete